MASAMTSEPGEQSLSREYLGGCRGAVGAPIPPTLDPLMILEHRCLVGFTSSSGLYLSLKKDL